jgi:uncharacterized protein (UPF0264 family)
MMPAAAPREGWPALLVSVRSEAEAEAALAGGAALIDVKEPARGPLGRADDGVVGAVVRQVAGRRPVSAARGELTADARLPAVEGLSHVKWGLAGWLGRPGWRVTLQGLRAAAGGSPPALVVAAYADWQRAEAPPVEEVLSFALEHPGGTLLLDTFDKGLHSSAGRPLSLLEWVPVPELVRLCTRCHEAGVRVALAGSLGPEQIVEVCRARPDWVAVRGAACRGGREGSVCATRVRALVEMLAAAPPVARRGG